MVFSKGQVVENPAERGVRPIPGNQIREGECLWVCDVELAEQSPSKASDGSTAAAVSRVAEYVEVNRWSRRGWSLCRVATHRVRVGTRWRPRISVLRYY